MADWDAIRKDYEGGMSFRALSGKYGVSKSVIGERKNKGQWVQSKRTDTRTVQDTQRVTNRDVNAGLRAAEALELRAKKLTYQEIAEMCGYSDASAARKAVLRELDRIVLEKASELRREESYILDKLHARLYEAAMDKNNEGWQWAADRVLTLSKARRELMGIAVRPEEELTQQKYIKKIVLTHNTPAGGSADVPNN
jgi:AraC-like DNA-binding protein